MCVAAQGRWSLKRSRIARTVVAGTVVAVARASGEGSRCGAVLSREGVAVRSRERLGKGRGVAVLSCEGLAVVSRGRQRFRVHGRRGAARSGAARCGRASEAARRGSDATAAVTIEGRGGRAKGRGAVR